VPADRRALALGPPPSLAELCYERLVRVHLARNDRAGALRARAEHERRFPRGARARSIEALLVGMQLGPYRRSARPDPLKIDPRSAIQSGEWRGVLMVGAGVGVIAAGYWAPELYWRAAAFFTPLVYVAGMTVGFAGLGVLAVALRDRLQSNE
jgi:hypothetical protein